MVRLIGVPPHASHAIHQVTQVVHHVSDALEVVARLRQGVDVVRVVDCDGAVIVPGDQEMLRLDSDVEGIPLALHPCQHPSEVLARAIHIGLVVHVKVAGEARDALGPGRRAIGVQVYSGHHVVGVWALSQPEDSRPRESSALIDDVVEMGDRHHLGLGGPVNVHELGQKVLDFVVPHSLTDIFPRDHNGAPSFLLTFTAPPRRAPHPYPTDGRAGEAPPRRRRIEEGVLVLSTIPLAPFPAQEGGFKCEQAPLRRAQDRRRGFVPLRTPYFVSLLVSEDLIRADQRDPSHG